MPVKTLVLLEVFYYIVTKVKSLVLIFIVLVLVYYGHAQVLGISVWIPEGLYIKPGIK